MTMRGFLNRVRTFDSCRGHSRVSCKKETVSVVAKARPRRRTGSITDANRTASPYVGRTNLRSKVKGR